MDPFPADCAKKFRPERLLARGGYGSVWLATQVQLDREVAVKLLHADLRDREHDVSRFLAEARVTAQLAHPNIVRVIDHGAEDAVPWIAFEYLPGRTLAQVLKDGPLLWPDALAIAAQIVGALEAAHARGVLHRDIKPSNIIEMGPGQVKVTDFGIAKWSQRAGTRTETGVIIGTPLYIAPELVSGQPATPATDLYALGVVLYEMLVGRPPFESASPHAILNQHCTEPPPPPSRAISGLPRGLDALVSKMLAKEPGQRHASAGDVVRALERLDPTGRVASTRLTVLPRPSRVPTGARTLLVASVLAAGLGLACGAALRFFRDPAASPVPPLDRPSPSPTVSAGLAPGDRAAFARALEGHARVLQADPFFRSIHATLSSTTPDIPGALRTVRSLEISEAGSFRAVSDLAERIERAVPHAAGAAFADARLLVRARGYRFAFWRRRAYCKRHVDVFQWAVDNGNDTVLELMTINVELTQPADHADGLALIQRYLDAARPALQALPEQLATGGAGFAELLDDLHVIAREAGWVPWTDSSRARLAERVEAFKRGLAADDRPLAYSIARLASTLWELGDGPTPVRRQALAQMAQEDLQMIRRQAPAADAEARRLIETLSH